jgi:hypothetical protein
MCYWDVMLNASFIYHQAQTKGSPEDCNDGCDILPPSFQLVKTEVINEMETDTDVTTNDGIENTDALKNDPERICFEDLIDATS